MARPAERQPKSPVARKLRKTLQVLAETTSESSFREAKQFICPVCELPVKPCQSDSKATCRHMLLEGTELQAITLHDREGKRRCLSCGKIISSKALAKNPLAELCPACTRKSVKTRREAVPKGVLP